jgi:CRISPR-associated endoribonuclease Cas6
LRLLLHLKPHQSHPYENDYHYHLQSAIYSLIREGGLPGVHERKSYKFFCFSNIFPFGDFESGVEKKLLVSSPDLGIIDSIERALLSRMRSEGTLDMGQLSFEISNVSKSFRVSLKGPEAVVHSTTPIVIRIPKVRYEEYGIKPDIDYDYVFWRETVPLEAFVKQLRDNIAKKWKEYYSSAGNNTAVTTAKAPELVQTQDEAIPEITYYKFIRSVSKPITVKQQRQMVIGSLWEIGFATASKQERRVLEFAVDCGFGERNSLGFGFMNTG